MLPAHEISTTLLPDRIGEPKRCHWGCLSDSRCPDKGTWQTGTSDGGRVLVWCDRHKQPGDIKITEAVKA